MEATKELSGARASSGSLSDACDAVWNPVVLDCGSGLIKAGFASEERPSHLVPSVVYRPDSKLIDSVDDIAASLDAVSLSTGDTPDSIAKKRRIEHCIERGRVKSWDDMEHLWHWLFSEQLRRPASDSDLILTHSSAAAPADKGVAATVLFEQFACLSVSILDEAPLALLATTTSDTGVILDSGAEVTTASVIYNGCVSTSNLSSLQLGGRDLTKYIATVMRHSAVELSDELKKSVFSVAKWSRNYGYFQSLDRLKMDLCRVSMSVDYAQLLKGQAPKADADPLSSPVSYTLPDGSVVPVQQATVFAPELLFNPSVVGDATMNAQFGERMYDGIVGLVKNSLDLASGFRSKDELITKSKKPGSPSVSAIPEAAEIRASSSDGTDPELYRLLLRNVSVCGGNTMFPGLRERFESELGTLLSGSPMASSIAGTPTVVASENRQFASWLGAAVIAEMSSMRDEVFVTRDEYMEQGTTAVFRKCN